MLQKVIHFFPDVRDENKMLTFSFFLFFLIFSEETHMRKPGTRAMPTDASSLLICCFKWGRAEMAGSAGDGQRLKSGPWDTYRDVEINQQRQRDWLSKGRELLSVKRIK